MLYFIMIIIRIIIFKGFMFNGITRGDISASNMPLFSVRKVAY